MNPIPPRLNGHAVEDLFVLDPNRSHVFLHQYHVVQENGTKELKGPYSTYLLRIQDLVAIAVQKQLGGPLPRSKDSATEMFLSGFEEDHADEIARQKTRQKTMLRIEDVIAICRRQLTIDDALRDGRMSSITAD